MGTENQHQRTFKSMSNLQSLYVEASRKEKLFSAKLVIIFITLFSALLIGSVMVIITMLALCVWAMRGPKESIQALAIGVIVRFLNPAVFVISSEAVIIGWVLLFVAGLRVLLFLSARNLSNIYPLLLYSLVVLALSFISSVSLGISLMKLLSFTIGVTIVLVTYSQMEKDDLADLKIFFLSLYAAIILLSIPTLLYPDIAYHRNGAGFQGILNHPQSFGGFLAPIGAWFLGDILFKKQKLNSISSILFVALVVLILMSQARTSATSIALSIITTVLIVANLYGLQAYWGSKSKAKEVILLLGVLLLMLVFFVPSIQRSAEGFIFKRESTTMEQAMVSRTPHIEGQWNNFIDSPIVGHGFGVYRSGVIPLGVTTFMGVPISAPVEKGFLPTAILEETGVIGALMFLYFLVLLSKRVVRSGDLRMTCLYFGCLYINVGEVVIFSMGGIGLFFWLLIGLAVRSSTIGGAKS